jgi:sodium transport system permease protein
MMGRAQRWRQFLVVLGKELTESARDRRTMLTALLLGPVGGPLLFAVMMSLGIERGQTDTREPARVAIVG